MVDTHRRRGTWSRKVDRFIAVSEFSLAKFVAAGFSPDRIVVKPNFTQDRPGPFSTERSGALYVGRLSPEKGIDTLLQAWSDLEVPLRLVGDGAMRGLVEKSASTKVVALGPRSAGEVAAEMGRAAFLVAPSVWPETFGLAIVEAYCQGLPVIASRIGAFTEIVDDGRTGLLCAPGDPAELVSKVRWAHQHPEQLRRMGNNARFVYEKKYSPSANFEQLKRIYALATHLDYINVQ